jgi:putative transposase
MGQRKEIVRSFVSKGLKVDNAVRIAAIKRSTYYYKPNGKAKGKKPSTHTLHLNGESICNDIVLQDIIQIITPEYHNYGYQVTTELLKEKGYIINHKKVYNLMNKNNLLHPKIFKNKNLNKQYIKYTVPPLEHPFATIEVDIKYIYIHLQKRNAFLTTFLCTFSRYAVVWDLSYSMKSNQILDLVFDFLNHVITRQNLNKQNVNIKIRTDNGPQFIARQLAEAFEKLNIKHEFIYPATPQENGHIESFHSTVSKLVCSRNIFADIEHARKIFTDFFIAYNNTRVMKSILYNSPANFLRLWESGVIGIKKNKRNKEIFFFTEKPTKNYLVDSPVEDLFLHDKNNTFVNSFNNHQKNSPVL